MENLSWDEYSMRRPAVAGYPAPVTAFRSGEPVAGVVLLGVRVTAYAIINLAEHRRRQAAGVGAVIDPGLLERLLGLPAAIPVADPVAWAELADQPPGILERGTDDASVTRHLESPLAIADVVVAAPAGRELRAIQDASLFAGFACRWVAAARSRMPAAAVLEAKVCGVGIVDPGYGVLLPAERPVTLTRDVWSWLLEEKAYRRWLSGRPGIRGTESRSPATDGARISGAG